LNIVILVIRNGIYEYMDNILVRTDELVLYDDCIRFSVIAKLGDVNVEKQFHLNRLLDGYFLFRGSYGFIENITGYLETK
jgi:hypothetical protein